MVLLFKGKNTDEYSECLKIVDIEVKNHFGEDTKSFFSWYDNFTLLVNIPNVEFFKDIQKDNERFFNEKNDLIKNASELRDLKMDLDVLNPRTFTEDVLENLSFVPEIICKE